MFQFKNIILPKYFYYNKLFDNYYIVGNPVVSNNMIINDKTLLILLYVIKNGITDFNIIKDKFLHIFFEKEFKNMYEKKIILDDFNDSAYRFKEELLILGDDFLTDIEKLSIVKNADKVIYLKKENIFKDYNKNSIFLGEQSDFKQEDIDKNIFSCIKKEIEVGKNMILVEYKGNSSFGSGYNALIKETSKKLGFFYKYIGTVSYIDKIYENSFMKLDPMTSGFISIDFKKLLQKQILDTTFQIIITRIGYLKGLDYVYGKKWKDNLKFELCLLKDKLLNFYKKDDYIYLINNEGVKKSKIEDIGELVICWIPGYTSIFIDSKG